MPRTWAALLLSTLVSAVAHGQGSTFGVGLSQILSGGEGIERDCSQRSYSIGVGGGLALPLGTRGARIAVTARAYRIKAGEPECVTDPFVPRDGTFTFSSRLNLQAARFVTSDLRMQLNPVRFLQLALGGGAAWHEGTDLPYLVGAVGVPLLRRGPVTLDLEAEYYRLRVATDSSRLTFVNFTPVNVEPLGRFHQWSHALSLAVSGQLKVF